MSRHYSNTPSESTHAIGVLGRLMRAFPARAVAEVDEVVDLKPQATQPVASKPVESFSARGGLLARLESWIWRQQQREREAYLAEATDIADLEARMRVLEVRRLRNHSMI